MILPDFKAFPIKGRILGVDWGARRTGIAVSDDARDFVFVRPAIDVKKNGDSLAKKIVEIAEKEKVVGIVLGLPLYVDGSDSETTKKVRDCAAELTGYTDLPIVFIEENLTSVAAQEKLGKVRINDLKQKLDSESAAVILENAISMLKRL